MKSPTYWKGYLRLSLVTCAVALVPATTDRARIRFSTLNRKTGTPVASQWTDSVTGEALAEDQEARGYEREADRYLILEDEDFDAVRLESTRTIDVSAFVAEDSIAWLWREKPHFLVPSDTVGAEAFAVIRAAMASTRKLGVARLVLARRERAVLLEPRGDGIVLWTLRYGDEVRDVPEPFKDLGDAPVSAKALALMTKLIRDRSRAWDPALAEDPVQDRLADLIEAKRKGRKSPRRAPTAESPPEGGNVVSILDALRRSIATETRKGR